MSDYPTIIIKDDLLVGKIDPKSIELILKSIYKSKFNVPVSNLIGLYKIEFDKLGNEDISIRNRQYKSLQNLWDYCLTIPKETKKDDKSDKISPKQIIDEMENEWYFCYDVIMQLPLMVKDGVSIDFTDKIAQKIDTYCNDVYGIPSPFAVQIKNVLLDRCENNKQKTYIRSAYINDICYYKLNDINMIIIDKNGWKITKNQNDLIFRDVGVYPQVIPKRGKVSLYNLFEMSRLTKWEKILYMGAHVSAFIEYIDHPIININGDHGCGKSAEAKNAISVIDPDGGLELNIWDTKNNFVVALDKRIMFGLDNLSHITTEQSNLFCMVSTGGGIVKRELYHNTKTLNIQFRATLIITSIDDIFKEPDVLDRCVHLNINKDDKKAGSFKFDPKVIPYKLGAILDCLVYYLNVKDEYKKTIISPIRLDDFYYVTLATAILNGFNKSDVDEAFRLNEMNNMNQLINSSLVGVYIMSEITQSKPFEGNMTLLNETMAAEMYGSKPYKSSINLSNNLNKILPALKNYGFEKIDIDSRRNFRITKNPIGFDGGFKDVNESNGF